MFTIDFYNKIREKSDFTESTKIKIVLFVKYTKIGAISEMKSSYMLAGVDALVNAYIDVYTWPPIVMRYQSKDKLFLTSLIR